MRRRVALELAFNVLHQLVLELNIILDKALVGWPVHQQIFDKYVWF